MCFILVNSIVLAWLLAILPAVIYIIIIKVDLSCLVVINRWLDPIPIVKAFRAWVFVLRRDRIGRR